jgi:hypothetical protein
MKTRLLEHGLTILLVALALVFLVVFVSRREAVQRVEDAGAVEPYVHLRGVDFGDPLHRALFRETLGIFYPGRQERNDSLVQAVERFRQERFAGTLYKTGGEERGLSRARLSTLGLMYAQFIFVYLIVMFVTYRASQSIAIFRFVKTKQGRSSYLAGLAAWFRCPSVRRIPAVLVLLVSAFIKGIAYAILFAPAYVIAYSLRSGVETDSLPFMILLGVVSNGLLIGAANRFSAFLIGESRRGYVLTSVVKNLDSSYEWHDPRGVPLRAVLWPMGLPPTHVFRHIFLNARHHYIQTMKEHASFLITGLIIIEMALNIQGHLGYELMRTILYRQYEVSAAIVLGIFMVVKITEIAVDFWFHRESRKYGNTG